MRPEEELIAQLDATKALVDAYARSAGITPGHAAMLLVASQVTLLRAEVEPSDTEPPRTTHHATPGDS